MKKTTYLALSGIVATAGLLVPSCSKPEATATSTPGGFSPEQVADTVYTVLAADRKVYAKQIVNRLVNEEKVIKAHENYMDEKTLPLPAQVFRMGAEEVDTVDNKTVDFSYSLQSLWPLNKENAKKQTDKVKEGLKFLVDNPTEKKWTGEEEIAGQKYFIGVYPDKAVAPACFLCHNNHPDKEDSFPEFKLEDVMGGVVIRIPVQ
ncbi:Tll0287-like domain-containing protein [Luteolibacter marinus]|uniref:Tll0287-like domain-containing protein n=1 Tax=Luteolibacter marinus TaxID=2776705 RepID=UPI0018680382|nr:DUF3365 domain-containing protein [Luteolibacter marinus]